MPEDGKQLEKFVAFVEKLSLPSDFEVSTNRRVFDEDGVPIAEFDVEIKGKVGTTEIAWLIECRDRRSRSAPCAWIRELVAKRDEFNFNKVTAVSTTDFSRGAKKYAREKGIDLRLVKSLNIDSFRDWLALDFINQELQLANLRHAQFNFLRLGLKELEQIGAELKDLKSDTLVLKSSTTGGLCSPADAFLAAVNEIGLFEAIAPNDPPKSVSFIAVFRDADHYIIETKHGPRPIDNIEFRGELSIERSYVPILSTAEYRRTELEQPISQVAISGTLGKGGNQFVTEFHRLIETGEVHIALRKVD